MERRHLGVGLFGSIIVGIADTELEVAPPSATVLSLSRTYDICKGADSVDDWRGVTKLQGDVGRALYQIGLPVAVVAANRVESERDAERVKAHNFPTRNVLAGAE